MLARGNLARAHVEGRAGEQATQRTGRKAGMPLSVAGRHVVLVVMVEAEDDDLASGTQHACALFQHAGGSFGVGQRVKHEDRVEGGGGKWQLVGVGDETTRVGVFGETLARRFDEAGTAIEANEAATRRRDDVGRRAVA